MSDFKIHEFPAEVYNLHMNYTLAKAEQKKKYFFVLCYSVSINWQLENFRDSTKAVWYLAPI